MRDLHGLITTKADGVTTTRRDAAIPTLSVGQGNKWAVIGLASGDARTQPIFNLLVEVRLGHCRDSE